MNMFLNFKPEITVDNVHYWLGSNNQIMIDLQFTDYSGSPLRAFKPDQYDQAINFLYLNGFKCSARQLNKAIKKC